MRMCRFCEKEMDGKEEICGHCGYNSQTDTMTPSFVRKKLVVEKKRKKISSGVKSIVFWGMLVIVFSLGIKYQGKIRDIISDVKNKSAQSSVKTNQNKATQLTDVRSYKAPADKSSGKDIKIEGIFYDPQGGKSCVMINGRLLSEKESYRNIFVNKINRDSVEVVQDNKNKVIRVSKKAIK